MCINKCSGKPLNVTSCGADGRGGGEWDLDPPSLTWTAGRVKTIDTERQIIIHTRDLLMLKGRIVPQLIRRGRLENEDGLLSKEDEQPKNKMKELLTLLYFNLPQQSGKCLVINPETCGCRGL